MPGRGITGDIDIGGIPRFGPQSSGNLRLVQNVFGGEYSLVHSRGRHLIKAGALAERYQDNMVNPTFSNGIYTFASVQDFLQNRAQRFIGLTPAAQFDRYWRFTLVGPLRAGHVARTPAPLAERGPALRDGDDAARPAATCRSPI